MAKRIDREFLAKNVYPEWKRRVKRAEHSVRIYSPYLGGLAVKLLENAPLESDSLSVVTDLSPRSGVLDYRPQLLAIARLLRAGIEVRSLPRLHAKVLLVDGQSVTVGSQNFTSYATKSKETTAAPSIDMSDSIFVTTLNEWFTESKPVDIAWVERLLTLLKAPAAALKAAQTELVEAYDGLEEVRQREEVARKVRASMQSRIRAAARSTRFRTAQSVAYARLDWADSDYDYETLMADNRNDLTQWGFRIGDSWLDRVSLDRGAFYPALLGPEGRMRFVRVNKTRITYVWASVRWGGSVNFGGQRMWLSASFPDDQLEWRNIIVRAKWTRDAGSGYRLGLRFDGQEMSVADSGEAYGPDRWQSSLVESSIRAALEEEGERERFFREILDPAPVPRNFMKDKNAADHFGPGRHQISLTQIYGRSVLLIEPR